MPKPIILIDCDAVLVNHYPEHIEAFNREFGVEVDLYDIYSLNKLTKPQRDFFFDVLWSNPNLYDNDELNQNQMVTLERLRKLGRLIVCSSPMLGHIESKYRFLKKYFSYIDIILCTDKAIIKGNILIDDAPHNINAFPGDTIIYDQPWNQQVVNGYRCTSFSELPSITERIIASWKQN